MNGFSLLVYFSTEYKSIVTQITRIESIFWSDPLLKSSVTSLDLYLKKIDFIPQTSVKLHFLLSKNSIISNHFVWGHELEPIIILNSRKTFEIIWILVQFIYFWIQVIYQNVFEYWQINESDSNFNLVN